MANKKMPKNAEKFYCEKCNFTCFKKSNWDTHITTRKHKMLINANEMLIEKMPTVWTCGCGRSYKHESSYCRHIKKCLNPNGTVTNNNIQSSNTCDDTSRPDIVNILLKQNKQLTDTVNDFKEMFKEVIAIDKGNTYINNNNNNTINNNQQFNLNFFLNETCKDAMNITDFIKSIQLNVEDLEKVGELGYAEGISRMLVRGLNELEVTKRPIHCSDLKRETIHIKDQDKWEKDNSNQDMLKKAIKDLSNRNIMLFDDWQKLNPGYDQYDNKNNDIYLKMLVQAMGPADEVAERRDFGKVIRRVAKTTIIDKEQEYN